MAQYHCNLSPAPLSIYIFQGVKRGIMELSDLLVVTKDDGDLKAKAKITQAEYISALKYMRPRLETWRPKVRYFFLKN